MSGFFGRLKAGSASTSPALGTAPVKRDGNLPEPTRLEKLLANAGPLRADGSDKFFGFENFGSTCYCNSIVQCLFYSLPFREQVINFPARSPPEALERQAVSAASHVHTALPNGLALHTRSSLSGPSAKMPARPAASAGSPHMAQGTRSEENKDSSEFKKKQALAVGPVLQMDYENAKTYGMNESLFSSLKDIFEAIIAHRSRIGVVSPHKLLEILRRDNEMFRTSMHQDAHEFLNLLLNEVVENVEQFSKHRATELAKLGENGVSEASIAVVPDRCSTTSRISNPGWVHELFEGTLTSETRCLTCENLSQRDEAFLDLSVDLEQHSSVTSCLRNFSEEEMLCERNKFHCDNCGGLQEAEKRMKIKRLPRILALHLKRFKYTEDLQRLQKLFHRVNYPFYLRLLNTTDDADDLDRLYELYAVVVHIGGGPYHGHYVSIIKTQDHGWLLFDDEMVEPVDKAYVRNFFGGENVLACAYVLFYQETTEEAMTKEQEAEGIAAVQQATELDRDIQTAALPNTNSTANGHAHHPVRPLQISTAEEKDDTVDFTQSVTAQTAIAPPASIHTGSELPSVASSPIQMPALSPKRSTVGLFKKEGREEKEARVQAKEVEKQQLKQKRKEVEMMRRENFQKQEQLRASLAARRALTIEEQKRMTIEEQKRTADAREPDIPCQNEIHDTQNQPNGVNNVDGKADDGLNRFKQNSKSVKGKSKLWIIRDKNKDKEKEEQSSTEDISHAESEDSQDQNPQADTSGKKTSKPRFSLRRKKSMFRF